MWVKRLDIVLGERLLKGNYKSDILSDDYNSKESKTNRLFHKIELKTSYKNVLNLKT